MKSDEMYFETDEELLAIYNKLLIPEERERIINEQHEDVFSRLSDAALDLSFIPIPEILVISDDEIYVGSNTLYSWAAKKPSLTSTPLF
jgi:hypothetical protein